MCKWLKTLKEDFSMIIWGFRMIDSIQPRYMLMKLTRDVFDASTPYVNIFMSARIINELTSGCDIRKLTLYVLLTIALNLFTAVIAELMDNVVGVKYQQFRHLYSVKLDTVILDMSYDKAEDPETHRRKQQILDNHNTAGGGLQRFMGSSSSIFHGVSTMILSITLTVEAFTTFTKEPVSGVLAFVENPAVSAAVAAVIIACAVVSTYVTSKNTKKRFTAVDRNVSTNRLYYHYIDHLENYRTGKDIRLYRQKDMLRDIFDTYVLNTKIMSNSITEYDRTANIIHAVVIMTVMVVSYAFIGLKALAGAFAVGNIIQYAGSIGRFREGLMGLMWGIGSLRTNTGQVRALKSFFEIPVKKREVGKSVERDNLQIEFRDVSFRYPGSEQYAVRNLSVKLNAGERLAVVGQNGSGKTTFIKLLCRLYDPTEGAIYLNGTDIREYDSEEYLAIFSVVFQDFNLFSFTLGQNIAASVDYDKATVEECIKQAGFYQRYGEMADKTDTYLYKDFDEGGVDISGGEAQKIALARALYKQAPFIILDEPTAALDPVAEFEIYSRFNEIVKNRTAVYISHRLSSCRFCDDIAVFHEGELIQRGTHDELLRDTGGKYRELWQSQAQYYV